MGCDVSVGDSWVEVNAYQKKLKPISVTTLPHPGFPTDLQAPMMALLATIDGVSVIQDTVYNDRFTHIAELQRLGADIQLTGNTAHVRGGKSLSSAPIMASDLRAGAALVLASLLAEGETSISRIYHIDRGYENFEEKMRSIGAQIQRTQEEG
jgi:UDP-N-acetylglucosamine 1-carboxyvinyltransferase